MKRNTTGIGRDGRSNAFAKPGEPTLATHHTNDRSMDKPGEPAHALGHRGHPIGGVVGGKTVRAPGALDIQPRQGAPKAHHATPYHVSTNARQIAADGRGGMGHPTAVVDGGQATTSAAAAPMAHAYGGQLPKDHGPAPVAWTMKSERTYARIGGGTHTVSHLPELGRAMLDEALANSSADDRAAHGRMVKPTIRVGK